MPLYGVNPTPSRQGERITRARRFGAGLDSSFFTSSLPDVGLNGLSWLILPSHKCRRLRCRAFQLAREATGRIAVAYRAGEGSRAGLMLDPVFAAALTAAKERIRGMEYRYVEEADQKHFEFSVRKRGVGGSNPSAGTNLPAIAD